MAAREDDSMLALAYRNRLTALLLSQRNEEKDDVG